MKKKYRINKTTGYNNSIHYYGGYRYPFWPFYFRVRKEDGTTRYFSQEEDCKAACHLDAVKKPSEFPKSLGWLP